MSGPLILISREDTGDDEVAQKHSGTTNDEDRLPTEFVDIHYGWNSRKEQQDPDHSSGKQRCRVRRLAEGFEN